MSDTIAAIATAPGRGSVGIVRFSGPACTTIASQFLGYCPPARRADYRTFRDPQGNAIDQGLALFFATPHSFTGEDVLELQAHGGPMVLDQLLKLGLSYGARPARPGEFSERAFLNGKIDLAQSEAIADLINASSEQAAKAAVRSLQGAFSEKINELLSQLIELRVYIESAIDFVDEEIDFLAEGRVTEKTARIIQQIDDVLSAAQQGNLLRDGMTLVIAGEPNVGKSSLLNRLSGQASAIVSDIAGTTRDIIREHIHIDGMPLHIIDTAGIHESNNPIEQEGIKRALQAIENADRVLLIVDDSQHQSELPNHLLSRVPSHIPRTVIRNKCDLSGLQPQLIDADGTTQVLISAKHNQGIELLRTHLKTIMSYESSNEGTFSARRRHLDALHKARQACEQGLQQLQLNGASELLAEELRLAQNALSEITGEYTTEDLLGAIFSTFCIGK